MTIDRRRTLALLGISAAAPVQARAEQAPAQFRHGVASGDPLQDRVILWTRLTTQAPREPVSWTVATDEGFKDVVARGQTVALRERDHTVKVDVTGLRPGTAYYYRFSAGAASSPVGRTRTLPAGPTQDVVLAVASCSLYPNGYFNAYRAIADLPRVDAVLHLGDYIYEYGGAGSYGMNSVVAGERPHDPPHECLRLEDYRRRHAQYKADADSQAAHARAPWIVVWDDHESANDSWVGGAENHQPDKEGDWAARKAAALKAYYEWMPIREPKPGVGLVEAAQRSFDFGDLASLIMVETRLGSRTKQLTVEHDLPGPDGKPDVAAFKAKLADPSRQMMGPKEEDWLAGELSRSVRAGHAWQVLGNQVVMAEVLSPSPKKYLSPEQLASATGPAKRRLDQYEQSAALGAPTSLDMWNGYPKDRERVYAVMSKAGARPVVVSGDSHAFWANELHDEGGRRVAVEFGTTGITSPGAGEVLPGVNAGDLIQKANPEVVFNDQVSRGYVLLTLTRQAARADLIAVSSIISKDFTTRTVKAFSVTPEGAGVSGLAEVRPTQGRS